MTTAHSSLLKPYKKAEGTAFSDRRTFRIASVVWKLVVKASNY